MKEKVALLSIITTIFTFSIAAVGCREGDRIGDRGNGQKTVSSQHLAIVAILPDRSIATEDRQERLRSLGNSLSEKGIGRVVNSEIRGNIVEVLLLVTKAGDVRGMIRETMFEWDPSVSYNIEERTVSE